VTLGPILPVLSSPHQPLPAPRKPNGDALHTRETVVVVVNFEATRILSWLISLVVFEHPFSTSMNLSP
jgi:hypothetical protein